MGAASLLALKASCPFSLLAFTPSKVPGIMLPQYFLFIVERASTSPFPSVSEKAQEEVYAAAVLGVVGRVWGL